MILLVEDDKSLSRGLAFALESKGFSVNCAYTVQEAERRLSNGSYELVLLDVMLPDGNGFDLCKKIRRNSSVPIIFLTVQDEETGIVMGLDNGADDYITKPFGLSELISRVNAVLRRYKQNGSRSDFSSKIISNDIFLDTDSYKVQKNGVDLLLSANEYRLLLLFLKNSDRVLSKEFILSRLSVEDTAFYDENTISVYIRRLREKIEDNPSEPVNIKTVRGLGYRWVERKRNDE